MSISVSYSIKSAFLIIEVFFVRINALLASKNNRGREGWGGEEEKRKRERDRKRKRKRRDGGRGKCGGGGREGERKLKTGRK